LFLYLGIFPTNVSPITPLTLNSKKEELAEYLFNSYQRVADEEKSLKKVIVLYCIVFKTHISVIQRALITYSISLVGIHKTSYANSQDFCNFGPLNFEVIIMTKISF